MAEAVLRGKVAHFKINDTGEGYHGFIRPHGCGESVRFTDLVVEGMSPALGEDVNFTLHTHHAKNCKRVWRAA